MNNKIFRFRSGNKEISRYEVLEMLLQTARCGVEGVVAYCVKECETSTCLSETFRFHDPEKIVRKVELYPKTLAL